MRFGHRKQQKRDIALGLDLGTGQIKAALVRRHRDKLELVEYAVRPLPPGSVTTYREPQFAAELEQLVGSLKGSERRAFVTISCSSAMVWHTEFPPAPLAEIKTALKLNSLTYLRRDFSSYYLDVFELKKGSLDPKSKTAGKTKVLIGGAQKEEVDACRAALTAAKIIPQVIELSAVSVINAFQVGHPEFKDEVVVLVDIGTHATSINVLLDGVPLITRIMHFGGAQLSEYISQVLKLGPREAEEEKLNMSEQTQELMRTALSPLARELRSSIDFSERQHDHNVCRIFACGGSARSAPVLKLLGEAIGIPIECWNPVQSLDISGLNGTAPQVQALGPSLAAAVGVAVSRLS